MHGCHICLKELRLSSAILQEAVQCLSLAVTAYLEIALRHVNVFYPLVNSNYKLLFLHRSSLLNQSPLPLHSHQHLGLLKDEGLLLVNYMAAKMKNGCYLACEYGERSVNP